MKRKQFIKQLMAAGVPRNSAAAAAQSVQTSGRSYFHELGRRLNALAVTEYHTRKAVMSILLYGKYNLARYLETVAALEGLEVPDQPAILHTGQPAYAIIGRSILEALHPGGGAA